MCWSDGAESIGADETRKLRRYEVTSAGWIQFVVATPQTRGGRCPRRASENRVGPHEESCDHPVGRRCWPSVRGGHSGRPLRGASPVKPRADGGRVPAGWDALVSPWWRYASFASLFLRAPSLGGDFVYRATIAQWHADRAALRPKVARVVAHPLLRTYVEERLAGMVVTSMGVALAGPQVARKGRRRGRRRA